MRRPVAVSGPLSSVWATAAGSILLIASGRRFSPVVGTCVYLMMGWGVVICYARIARVVSHRKLWTLVLGGVLYSLGAVLNLLHWPTLWPEVFDTHALFHLFVIGGSLAHYWFILKVVVPYKPGPGDDLVDGNESSWHAASVSSSAVDHVQRTNGSPESPAVFDVASLGKALLNKSGTEVRGL